MKWLVLGLIVLVIVVSGCTEFAGTDVLDIAKTSPQVKQFLQDYPDAKMKIANWDNQTVSNNIESIRAMCGSQMKVKEYYKVDISSNNSDLLGWVDILNKKVDCVIITPKATTTTTTTTSIPQPPPEPTTTISPLTKAVRIDSVSGNTLYIRNVGTSNINKSEINVYVNNALVTCDLTPSTISPGLVASCILGTACNTGDTIKVVSPAGMDTESCVSLTTTTTIGFSVTSCDDNNAYTNDYFDNVSQQCIHEKILFSKIVKPSSVFCGIKGRDTIPKNPWIGTPIDCSDKLLENDSDFYTISGTDIKLNNITAIELGFKLNDPEFKEIVEVKTHIDMICKFYLSIYTLTEFNEWEPDPDSYFHCHDWTKAREIAEVNPLITNNETYVLITPGSGDSEGDIDYAVLNVSFYKT
ncbi:MAG: hypothetical protein NT129_06485 [Candidatus Aenigmarchaeota archaeon]|nr:hypothetical protein [Candidatus Aenigmarchaeota archaeon]